MSQMACRLPRQVMTTRCCLQGVAFTNMKGVLIYIATTCLVWGGAWRARAAEWTVDTWIEEVANRMVALERIEQTATLTITVTTADREDETIQERLFRYQRPDRVKLVAEMSSLAADGQTLTVAFPALGYFMTFPMEDGLAAAWEEHSSYLGAMMFPDIAALLATDPAAHLRALLAGMEREGLAIELHGAVEHNGRDCWHLRLVDASPGGLLADGMDVWVDQATGLIAALSAEVDMAAGWDGDQPMPRGMPVAYSVHYAARVRGGGSTVTDDRFALDVTGLVEVADFEALADAMQTAEPPDPQVVVGQPAPDFSLPLLDGSTFHLAEHRGWVVLVDFWATWCPPCVESLPYLQSLYSGMDTDQVVFIGVSLDQEAQVDRVRAMLDLFDIGYKVGINAAGDIATAYGVHSIPHLFVIDGEGIVRHQKVGFSVERMKEVAAALEKWSAVEGKSNPHE